jgi:hypothetical protein
VFVPELVARSIFRILPALSEAELVIIINAAILYFGAYFLFAIFWPQRLKQFFGSAFVAGLILWWRMSC